MLFFVHYRKCEYERERERGFKVRNKQNYDASRVNDFLKKYFS